MNVFTRMIILSAMVLSAMSLYGQTEEELDRLLLEDGGGGTEEFPASGGKEESPFSFNGFVDLSTALGLKEKEWYDNRGRLKLKPSYHSNGLTAYGDIDCNFEVANDGANKDGQIEAVELYVKGERGT